MAKPKAKAKAAPKHGTETLKGTHRQGGDGTKQRRGLKRQEEDEQQLAANVGAGAGANPADDDQGEQQQQEQQALTFMQHDFGLDRRLIKAVAKMGFVYPTLVQNKCIPLALKGKDLLVSYVSVRLWCILSVCRVWESLHHLVFQSTKNCF